MREEECEAARRRSSVLCSFPARILCSFPARMQYESPSQDPGLTVDQRLKLLYPMVNEEETPLPRSWSTKVTHL